MSKTTRDAPLSVTSADYAGDLTLRISYSDGTENVVDFAPFFAAHHHPQYDKYARPSLFKRFTLWNGNIAWGKNADLILPVAALHANSFSVRCDDTLETRS